MYIRVHGYWISYTQFTHGLCSLYSRGAWWPTVTLPRMLCICHPCAAPTICRLSSIHPTHTVVYSVNGDPPMEDVSPGLIRPQIDPPYTVNFGWGPCNGCCVPAILMLIPLYRLQMVEANCQPFSLLLPFWHFYWDYVVLSWDGTVWSHLSPGREQNNFKIFNFCVCIIWQFSLQSLTENLLVL